MFVLAKVCIFRFFRFLNKPFSWWSVYCVFVLHCFVPLPLDSGSGDKTFKLYDQKLQWKNFFVRAGAPSTVDKLDKRLLTICPPHSFTRLPRSLYERRFWKASEWRNWLLFYSLPTLLGVLRDRYWRHAALLVEAVYTLLLTEISPRQLQHASKFLLFFT